MIAKKVAEAGVLSDSFNPRNVCWTMERGYRMIDFGRARFTSNPKSIQAWISMAAVELEVWPEEKLTSDE